MATELEVSGERLIEDEYRKTPGGYVIYLMHLASYRFAEDFCRGRRVLDLGCGSGYGAAQIARVASNVHAVDVSEQSVAYAREHYPCENVEFSVIKPDAPLPFSDESFDVVLSFQVIEHVRDDRSYLREAARVLSPQGTLVLITPDRRNRLFPGQQPWNRWHLREYSETACLKLVEESFVVEKTLRMGASGAAASLELKRYRLLKWLTLPFTLPGFPSAWRRFGLNLLHGLKKDKKSDSEDSAPYGDFGFSEGDISFSASVDKSLNLVAVAKPRKLAATAR